MVHLLLKFGLTKDVNHFWLSVTTANTWLLLNFKEMLSAFYHVLRRRRARTVWKKSYEIAGSGSEGVEWAEGRKDASLGRVGREIGEEGFLLNGKVLSSLVAVTAEREQSDARCWRSVVRRFSFFKYVCGELSELILKR